MSKLTQPKAIDIAQAHWSPLPDWVRRIAEYSDKHTQREAGSKMGYSASLVNQVLKNKYPGNMTTVQSCAERAFNEDVVACPILGPIPGSECLKHQTSPYDPTNHRKVALFRQCRRCPHRCRGNQ